MPPDIEKLGSAEATVARSGVVGGFGSEGEGAPEPHRAIEQAKQVINVRRDLSGII